MSNRIGGRLRHLVFGHDWEPLHYTSTGKVEIVQCWCGATKWADTKNREVRFE